MRREDFAAELERLDRAWGGPPMTPVRAEAMWRAYGHHELGVWRAAVDRACLDPRAPGGDRLEKLVERAAEGRRAARVSACREAPTLPTKIPEDAPDHGYGQFRLDVLRRVIFDGLSRQGVASELESAIRSGLFPKQDWIMREEIEGIREENARRRWGSPEEVLGLGELASRATVLGVEIAIPEGGPRTPFERELIGRELDAREGKRPGWVFWMTRKPGESPPHADLFRRSPETFHDAPDSHGNGPPSDFQEVPDHFRLGSMKRALEPASHPQPATPGNAEPGASNP